MQLSDLLPGDRVTADAGFTYIRAGEHVVQEDERGLYVACDQGKHYLDGQEDERGELVGFTHHHRKE